jgi:hypothetical protein
MFDFGMISVHPFLRRDGGGFLVEFRDGRLAIHIWNFRDAR